VYRYLVFHIYHVIAKAFGTIEDRMDDFCQWRFIRHPYRLPTLGGSPDYAEAKENIRKEWKDHKQMPGLCIEYCIFYLAHREGRNILLMIDNCDPKGIDTLLGFFSVGSHMLRCFNSNECLNDDSRKADFWEKHPFVDRDKKLGGTVLMPHLIRLIITARPSTVHGFKTAYAKDSEAGLNAFPYPELRQMTDAPRVTEILENRYDLMEYREKEKDSFIRIGEDLVT
jgi:hypothetical protein